MTQLGPLQLQMLWYCRRHPDPHAINPNRDTVRVARSLEKRGLLQITDCGISATTGRPVLMISLPPEADS